MYLQARISNRFNEVSTDNLCALANSTELILHLNEVAVGIESGWQRAAADIHCGADIEILEADRHGGQLHASPAHNCTCCQAKCLRVGVLHIPHHQADSAALKYLKHSQQYIIPVLQQQLREKKTR